MPRPASEPRPSDGRRPSATWPGSPGRTADSAGRTKRSTASTWPSSRALPESSPNRSWTAILTTRADAPDERTPADRHDREALLVERARLLRRLGRHDEALATWRDLGLGGGRWAGVAWIEVAKILEHRRRDPVGALEACGRADRIAERARFLGQRLPQLESDLSRRRRRLARRIAAASRSGPRVPRGRAAEALADAIGGRGLHEPANPVADHPGERGGSIGDGRQPRTLDDERAGRRRELGSRDAPGCRAGRRGCGGRRSRRAPRGTCRRRRSGRARRRTAVTGSAGRHRDRSHRPPRRGRPRAPASRRAGPRGGAAGSGPRSASRDRRPGGSPRRGRLAPGSATGAAAGGSPAPPPRGCAGSPASATAR